MIEILPPDASIYETLPNVKLRPETAYVPSQYALPFEHRGKAYVFHTLTKQCICGTLPASAKAGAEHDDLISARFLIPSGQDECAFYLSVSSLMRLFSRKKGSSSYTIMPTLGCNARCVYCYEQGMKQTVMTPAAADQVVRFIMETHGENEVRLAWFGGEPLLCPETIDRICNGLREAGLAFCSSMVTNGSLITPEIIRKMVHDWNLDFIQVSMDGSETDYISRKQYYVYHDYYHKVMEAVSAMSEAGIPVSIRCNVDEKNWDGTSRFLQDLQAGIKNKQHVSLYFDLLDHIRRGENDARMWAKIVEARGKIESAGFRTGLMNKLVKGFCISHCLADAGGMVIAPDGSLYACEHCPPESRFGDIWHGVTDEQCRNVFCRADRPREECHNCPFLPYCTGFASCPVRETHCKDSRKLITLDLLKRRIDNINNETTDVDVPVC